MTACLYISPDDVPALIADTLVTDRSQAGKQIITPANDSGNDNNPNYSYARLARKLYLVGERTALSVAGDENRILDFLNTVAPLAKHIEKSDRPMRMIGDLADNYMNSENGKRNVVVLGASVADVPGGILTNRTAGYYAQTLPILGQCGAIGSGREEVLSMAKSWVFQMQNDPAFKNHPPSTILNFASVICTDRLAQEFLNQQSHDDSWGGYVEHAYFDPYAKRWVRGGKRLHLFFLAFRVDAKTMTVAMPSRLILYDPGKVDGHVLSVNIDRNGTRQAREWLLENILEEDRSNERFRGPNYWNGLQPEATSLVISLAGCSIDEGTMFISAGSEKMKEVYFKFGENYSEYGISDRWMDDLGSKYCEMHGMKYQPYRSLA